MAKTDVITAIDAANPPIVNRVEYRGNVQHIPFEFSTDGVYSAEAIEISKKLPSDAYVIGIDLTCTAIASGELDIGFTGNADGIIDGQALTSAVTFRYVDAPVSVGGKALIGTLTGTMSTDSINGYILVVTNEA
jgi:hypothetical protein